MGRKWEGDEENTEVNQGGKMKCQEPKGYGHHHFGYALVLVTPMVPAFGRFRKAILGPQNW